MRIIRNFINCKSKEKVVVSLGNFDGVHLGHQFLLSKLKKEAESRNASLLIISFEPHPSVYFKMNERNIRILSFRDKVEALSRAGVDILLVQQFNDIFSSLSAKDFCDLLTSYFEVEHIIIGYDFAFGYKRSGDYNFLLEYAKNKAFSVERIEAKKTGENINSSSIIRDLIKSSKISQLESYLGYKYFISGKVIAGNKIARTLGYPTANIKLHQLCRPLYGVYATKVLIDNKLYNGMANIGIRPTLDSHNELLEVNIFDFERNLYGKRLKVELLKHIRGEKKFANINDLKAQIAQDEKTIKEEVEF